VATVLERATARGATTVTEPTPFNGETEGGSNVVFSTLDEVLRSLATRD
jgi:hypothetical protein